MTTTEAPRYSAFAKRHFAAGKAEGEARGELKGVLKARGLTLTEELAALVESCDDLVTLQKWSEAALTANDPDDIFNS